MSQLTDSIIDDREKKYPDELGFSDDQVYGANLGEIINKLLAMIKELEERIYKLENPRVVTNK